MDVPDSSSLEMSSEFVSDRNSAIARDRILRNKCLFLFELLQSTATTTTTTTRRTRRTTVRTTTYCAFVHQSIRTYGDSVVVKDGFEPADFAFAIFSCPKFSLSNRPVFERVVLLIR